jgi:O-antigen/teichoic acid export membrane protein
VKRDGGLLSGSAFFLAARVLGAVMTYGLFMLLGRWLGKAELGIYVTAFSWCLVLSHIASLGFPRASLRFFAEGLAAKDRGLLHGYIRRSRQLVIGLSVALAGIAAAVLALVVPPEVRAVTVVAVASAPLLAYILLQSSFALAMSWRRLYMLPNAILRPTGLLVGVLLVWLVTGTLSALSVVTMHAAVMIVIAAGQAWLLHGALAKAVEPAPDRYETRTWVTTSVPLLLVSLYASYFFEYNVLFFSAMLPPDAIGVLGAAHRVAFLLGFVVFAVDSASLPGLARHHRVTIDRREMQADLTHATRLKTAIVFVGFLGLVVLGRPLLGLFGEGFEDGYALMLVLAASVVLKAAIGPAPELLGITGYQNVTLAVCAAGMVASPLLALLLVPSMGAMGGAVSILVVTTIGRLLLHRAMWIRRCLVASVLGPRKNRNIRDVRRGRVETCEPDGVVKCFGAHVDAEFQKAAAMKELFRDDPFVSPAPLSVEGPRITLEFVPFEATLRGAYVDYVMADDVTDHPFPGLVESAATLLAKLHSELDMPAAETWTPTPGIVKDLESCGFSVEQLMAPPLVPLHQDFCTQNLGYRANGELVVLDPSPDYLLTFHPHTHGPAYFDLGMFLSGTEGRLSPAKYPKIHWDRVPGIRERLITTYNLHAARPVDPRLAHALGFCLTRHYFRGRFRFSNALARAASWMVYNRIKGNDPRVSGADAPGPSPQRA